ncbi:MAG TPA: hypothetical protein VFS21_06840 [Roseiflexaceae bacterium]|nr:hypothetical protein [Roseiflexaceae bacterium]
MLRIRRHAMCWWCQHFIVTPTKLGFHFSCVAFPDEVPDAIYDGEFDHREPFPGDNGIRFELAPFDIVKDRWIFQSSSQPQELFGDIENIFSVFDTYRATGLLYPPINPDSGNKGI